MTLNPKTLTLNPKQETVCNCWIGLLEDEGTALADAMMRSLDNVICVCDMGVLFT